MSGIVERFEDGVLVMKRRFRGGGSYDSLNADKRDGDWGDIEIALGGKILRRRYFRLNGQLVGELYNIQSPAEFGSSGVWYVDLEVDVVRLPNGRVTVVDLDDLDRLERSGAADPILLQDARKAALALCEGLRHEGDWRMVSS